jgi:hypothetical protein
MTASASSWRPPDERPAVCPREPTAGRLLPHTPRPQRLKEARKWPGPASMTRCTPTRRSCWWAMRRRDCSSGSSPTPDNTSPTGSYPLPSRAPTARPASSRPCATHNFCTKSSQTRITLRKHTSTSQARVSSSTTTWTTTPPGIRYRPSEPRTLHVRTLGASGRRPRRMPQTSPAALKVTPPVTALLTVRLTAPRPDPTRTP